MGDKHKCYSAARTNHGNPGPVDQFERTRRSFTLTRRPKLRSCSCAGQRELDRPAGDQQELEECSLCLLWLLRWQGPCLCGRCEASRGGVEQGSDTSCLRRGDTRPRRWVPLPMLPTFLEDESWESFRKH